SCRFYYALLRRHQAPAVVSALSLHDALPIFTSHHALPLLNRNPGGLVVEMTDGTDAYNAAYRADVGFFYDLVKVSVQRMAKAQADRKSTRLNSSHVKISYAVFCLKK